MTSIIDLTEIIKTGSNDQLEIMLADNPALAEEKTEAGISILLYAAYCKNSEAVELIKKYKKQLDISEAVSTGELAITKELIKAQPNLVNEMSKDGFFTLGLACFFGHLEIAKFLIENGAVVNLASANSFQVAPIHSACANSNFAIAELLLKNGANPNIRQQNGVTPLHTAAHNGNIALVKLLLHFKADVFIKMDGGKTPLAMAIESGHDAVAEILKMHGGY